MGFFSFCFTHCVLSEGSGPAIWSVRLYIIRCHDVAPELTRQNFETRGYVHKVSNPLHGIHEIYDQGMWIHGTRSRLLAIATIKEFMFVLVWWLAICSLKYTWGCEGLWTPQYPPNQPRVIHDWFPFQQKDWIRFWIYHQNNQPEILEIQVHFVPYPDPYPFHTRIMPCRTHPPSPPFVDIQVYSTSSSSSSSSDSDSDDWKRKQVLACSSCPTGLMNILCMCYIYYLFICMCLFLYLYYLYPCN